MDDPISSFGDSDDPISSFGGDALVECQGCVTQRSATMIQLPPAHFIMADPTVALPVMQINIKEQTQGGWPRTVRVWLWGVWCDRLSEIVHRGDHVRVVSAEAPPPVDDTSDSESVLMLPPVGANPAAAVPNTDFCRKLRRPLSCCEFVMKVRLSAITVCFLQAF